MALLELANQRAVGNQHCRRTQTKGIFRNSIALDLQSEEFQKIGIVDSTQSLGFSRNSIAFKVLFQHKKVLLTEIALFSNNAENQKRKRLCEIPLFGRN